MIQYEDSDLPEIAIAPEFFDNTMTEMWVRSHGEPMMRRESDGHWMLAFFGPNNSVQLESVEFWRITDVSAAAAKMRRWLDQKGLLASED